MRFQHTHSWFRWCNPSCYYPSPSRSCRRVCRHRHAPPRVITLAFASLSKPRVDTILCACAMSQTAPHRHARPLGAGCSRAVLRPPPPRHFGAAPEVRGLGGQPRQGAELAHARRSRQRVSTYLSGAWHTQRGGGPGYTGNHPPAPPPGLQLQLARPVTGDWSHRARVLGRASWRPSESHNLGTCVPRNCREPDMTLPWRKRSRHRRRAAATMSDTRHRPSRVKIHSCVTK